MPEKGFFSSRRLTILLLFFLIFVPAFSILFNPTSIVYGEPSPVTVATSEASSATRFGTQRKLVKLNDGTLYCVYPKQLAGNYQIYVAKSTDNGATLIKQEDNVTTFQTNTLM